MKFHANQACGFRALKFYTEKPDRTGSIQYRMAVNTALLLGNVELGFTVKMYGQWSLNHRVFAVKTYYQTNNATESARRLGKEFPDCPRPSRKNVMATVSRFCDCHAFSCEFLDG